VSKGGRRGAATGRLRLVLATGNPGKVAELRTALAGRDIELTSAADAGIPAFPPEEGTTYEENALVKAGHVATHAGLPALADDSGLEVDALKGAPGVHSARFGGDGLGDGERVAHLLSKLRDVPDPRRTARFVSVLALATPAGEVRTFEGRCEGRILHGPRGHGGFGYDPVFYCPDLGKPFGQASRDEKRAVSHRGRALDAFLRWLDGPEADATLRARDPELIADDDPFITDDDLRER
jgi:XTP/dITP diphosphohydrolase